MANEERKREDLFIKPKRRAKNFFITSSAKMDNDKITKTTISSSVFTEMSKSFSDGEYLLDDAIREPNASILYMLQEMQQDIDDVYNEVSASAFQASYFPFATMDSCSIGFVSSSLIPDKDGKHHLGAPSREWQNLHIDGTAHIDSLAMGTTVTVIKDEDNMSSNSATALATQQSIKKYVDDNAGSSFTATGITGSFTALSASIATDIGNAGGADFSSVGEDIIPDGDNTRDLGSKSKEFKDLYIDGTANIDSLSADSFVKPTAPVVQTATSLKSSLVDVTGIHTLVLNSSKALSISGLAAAHDGQEITIMNIGSGAVTISRSTKASPRTIYGSSNITINQHQVYKFVCSPAQVWYAFV